MTRRMSEREWRAVRARRDAGEDRHRREIEATPAVCQGCGVAVQLLPEPLPSGQVFQSCACLLDGCNDPSNWPDHPDAEDHDR